ncbi:hypothetical protein SLEP1_g36342 [Rubroshorea leprosula]|nr:hypothetical protein SLEP1_g36342 [Rubroshorea leprosula]
MKEEYEQATVRNMHVSSVQGSNKQSTEKWTPPPDLIVKINYDAAVSLSSNRAGMAVVCRDSRGSLLDGLVFKQAVASVLMAEALALRAAIEEWNHEQMWRAFSGYGRVIDICVPNRKDKYGRRFGFVRFQDVKNVSMMEKELDQIKVGGVKIHVNQPRFDRQTKMQKEGDRKSAVGAVRFEANRQASLSYAEALRGVKMNRLGTAQDNATEQLRIHTEIDRNATHRMNGKREWIAKNKDVEWRGWEFKTKELDFEWVKGSFVGTARAVELIPTIQEKFYMERYFSVSLKPMGGKLVISKQLTVKIDGEFYNIKCVEEEHSNNLFTMRSDHVINSMSSSEQDSESWSPSSVEAIRPTQGEDERFSSFSDNEDKEDNDVAPWFEWEEEGKKENQ